MPRSREYRGNGIKSALLVVVLLIAVTWIGSICRKQDVTPASPTPVAVSTPTPGTDSGFHMAMTQDGTVSRIDKRYDAMTDDERGLANTFAHKYPDGQTP